MTTFKFNSLKSVVAIIMSIIAALSSLSLANIGKVTLEIKENVTTESESIVCELVNGLPVSISFGEDFKLEQKQNDEWVEVKQVGETNAIGISIYGLMNRKESINIKDMFGKQLEAGEYKLSKEYSSIFGKGTSEVVFTVTEA